MLLLRPYGAVPILTVVCLQVVQNVLDRNRWAAATAALATCAKLFSNIVRCNNSNAAFRKVKCSNSAFQSKVRGAQGACDVLQTGGFALDGDRREQAYVFPESAPLQRARALADRCAPRLLLQCTVDTVPHGSFV